MPMLSSTSHLIMRLIYVSCAVMSLMCWTVQTLSAGGGDAGEEWAFSHQSMCSQFTTELSCTDKTYSSITHTLHKSEGEQSPMHQCLVYQVIKV